MRAARDLMAGILLGAALACAACSGCEDDISISGRTVAEARLVRPGVTVTMDGGTQALFEDRRLLPGSGLAVDDDGRALVILDHGARVVADRSTTVTLEGMEEIGLEGGRLWVDAGEGETVKVTLGEAGELEASGCSSSIEVSDGALHVYVAAGELTYVLAGGSGTVREGERLDREAGGAPEVSPSGLWQDWTGGLAQAGPRPLETPTGVGAIRARAPGALGQERSPLVIRRQDVRVAIEGDLAVTETVQEFFNPASETLEGIYRLRIPRDAVLQGFAVDRDGTMVEGTVVERSLARKTYDRQVYAGSPHDPALLRWIEPGTFEARIYPIEAGAVRRISYRYTQWLEPSGREGDRRVYVFPMGNETLAPVIGEFSLSASLDDTGTRVVRAGLGARVDDERVVFSASDFAPRSDFTLELLDVHHEDVEEGQVKIVTADYDAPEPLPHPSAGRKLFGRADEETYFYTQLALRPEDVHIEPATSLRMAVVLDLSAGTDRELADLGTTVVDDLLRHLGPRDSLAVLAGDLRVDVLGGEAAANAAEEYKEKAIEALSRRPTGGATDIGEILTGAAALVGDEPGGVVVYVGDALPTVGEMDLEELLERIERLPYTVRTFGVGLGEESNLSLLTGLARRGGFATRVSDRTEAARTAYRILSDASVPVFEDVTFEIDGGVERLYPRGARTMRVDVPMRIIGRLTGEKEPELVTVRGRYAGEAFTVKMEPVIEEIDDHGDLRRRWATRRLEGLIEEGAGREAIVELGNRFSLVTPFNSILVPSAGPGEETSSSRTGAPPPPVSAAPSADEPEAVIEDLAAPAAEEAGGKAAPKGKWSGAGVKVTVGVPTVKGSLARPVIRRVIRQHQTALRQCHMQHAAHATQTGRIEVKFVVSAAGEVQMAAVAGSTVDNSELEGCVAGAFQGWTFPKPKDGGIVIVTIDVLYESSTGAPLGGGVVLAMPAPAPTTRTTTSLTLTHTTETTVDGEAKGAFSAGRKACLLSSLMLLEEKVELWQERLGERATAGRAMTVWREAKRRCELRTMKDRRALARVILSRVRGIPARCELVQAMSGEPAVASYIRSKILASLTTPHRIALVMQHCDGAVLVGPEELEEVLAKAKSTEAKIKAVKALMALYPLDMELELTLLDLLEEEGSEERLAEAMRLARELRHAPYADERVRTRVGEFYMRNDREEEARRTFSEIVEFAPFSPGARRRLGDLYRNYGWSEDAYRQFETLWSMVPEDESTLILMAEAAADAGRTDEALRLAERVSQSGAHSGITADVARLFNAIRLARLRVAARAEGDEGKLKELMKRSRRAGVLRETPDLSVVLAWDHPDVKMKLFARYRGSEVQRAPMVAPHFGCEALHESESSGEVLVQVERDAESVRRETRGRLVVIWYAGTAEETVQVIDVVLDGEVGRKGELPSKAWLLSPPPGEAEPTEPLEFDLLAL